MSKINAAQDYVSSRRNSFPVFGQRKSATREFLEIEEICGDGIFKLEPGESNVLYDCCYLFEDINYISKDEPEQEGMLEAFMKWYKLLGNQCKIFIASEQKKLKEFIEEIYHPLNTDDYPNLSEGIGRFIVQKIEEGNQNISKLMYLVVTCRADSYEDARMYFNVIDTSFKNLFANLGCDLYRLGTDERLTILERCLKLDPSCSFRMKKGMQESGEWRSIITPQVMDQNVEGEDHLIINNKAACLMSVTDYDNMLLDEKTINNIVGNSFPVFVCLDIEPIPKKVFVDTLENKHMANQKNMADQRDTNFKNNQIGAGPTFQSEKKNAELQEYLERAYNQDEVAVWVGYNVMVYASNPDELAKRVDTCIARGKDAGFVVEPCFRRQMDALHDLLPLGGRKMDHMMRDFFASSVVALNPFNSRDLCDEGGFFYGLNRDTKQLIIANRKNLKAPHSIVCGHTGGGKSFFVKSTEIAQSLVMTDDDVILLDPNNEQKEFIMSVGGAYYDLTPQSDIYLNPFEVPLYIMNGTEKMVNEFVSTKVFYANNFIESIMRKINYDVNYSTKVERAVENMYAKFFAGKAFRMQPTLKDLREEFNLKRSEDPIYGQIHDALYTYTEGAYDMFAHQSNVDMNNRLVGFGLARIKDIWEPVMVTVMHFMGQRIESNFRKKIATRFIVDECQILTERESSRQLLLYAIATYRKVGGILTLLFQNVARVLEHPDLRDMFSNCDFKVFLEQEGNDLKALLETQYLSSSEQEALSEARPGLGIMIWNRHVYKFNAVMEKDNPMFADFDTDFHRKAQEEYSLRNKEKSDDVWAD